MGEAPASNQRARPCGELDPWLSLVVKSQGFSRNTHFVSDARSPNPDASTHRSRRVLAAGGMPCPFPFLVLQDARTLRKTWFDWPSMRGLSRAAGPPCLVLHSSALYCRLPDLHVGNSDQSFFANSFTRAQLLA